VMPHQHHFIFSYLGPRGSLNFVISLVLDPSVVPTQLNSYVNVLELVNVKYGRGLTKHPGFLQVEELIRVPVQRSFISSVAFRSAAALFVGGLAVVAGVHYMKR
jgi:hypothetical protein